MEAISVKDYWFSYPTVEGESSWAIQKLSLAVEEGEFCLLCGMTGCGKSTFLKACKPELAPVGTARGDIDLLGRHLVVDGSRQNGFTPSESASMVGFVMQDPASQIVCDTVWHELAFGLENLGTPQDQMRRRVAEIAHFFGIEPWMDKSTESLSGGQKQLLNLASTLVMLPQVLLLDEPTAMLDPNARRQFVDMLARVNAELGITVVVATHSPEEFERYKHRIISFGQPILNPISYESISSLLPESSPDKAAVAAIKVSDAFFRYDRSAPFVLRGLNVQVNKGTVHAFVGGNGCGKSTLLKCMAGISKVWRGSVKNELSSSQAMLPQDPKALLVCDTVLEELCEWQSRIGYSRDDVDDMLQAFGLSGFENRHPYDLSGGQRQILAFAKILLCKPNLLFLDEPTKGLDALAAADIARIVRNLADSGKTIVMVTHDLDLACLVADQVSMLFDGELACTESARDFFVSNIIYAPSKSCRLFSGYAQIMGCKTVDTSHD